MLSVSTNASLTVLGAPKGLHGEGFGIGLERALVQPACVGDAAFGLREWGSQRRSPSGV
jgi:hypothetical protein